MKKRYKVNQRNSTVLGYPGRNFDWSKFCWDRSEIHKAIFKGQRDMKAPLPWVDSGLIAQVVFLGRLAELGVEFAIFRYYTPGGGMTNLSVGQLEEYLTSPDDYLIREGAIEAGVSIAKWMQWWNVERKEDGRARCQAMRIKKGRRQQCNMGVEIPGPKEFDPTIDLYCWHHSRF